MSDSDKSVAYEITADGSGFIKAMDQVAAASNQAAGAIKGHFEGVQSAFSAVSGKLAALGALVAGGAFFKQAIDSTNKLASEQLSLSKRLGISGDAASVLNTALKKIGSDSDTYIGAFDKFAKQIKKNEQGLQDMGLATRDANGNLRNGNELFTEALQSVSSYKAGIDQNIAAQHYFGRSIDDVLKLQKLTPAVMADAAAKTKDLGLTLTKEGAEGSIKFKMAMADVGLVLQGIYKVVGEAVMPIFTQLATWFADMGPTAVFVFKIAIDAVATAFQALIWAIKVAWDALRAIADPLFTIGSAIKKLLSGDITGATNDMAKIFTSWGNQLAGVWDRIKDDSKKTWTEVSNLWSKGTPVAAPKGGNNTMGEGDGKGDKSRMAQWEATLADKKAALEREGLLDGQYREMSKAAELKYWQDLGAMRGLSQAEQVSLSKKAAEVEMTGIKQTFETRVATLQAEEASYKSNTDEKLRIERQIQSMYQQGTKEYEAAAKRIAEIQRQALEQDRQVATLKLQAGRDAQLMTLTLEEQTAKTAEQLGLISHQDLLTDQAGFENRRSAIMREGLQERLRLAELDPDRNPVEVARIQAEIEQLERQHQIAMGAIKQQQIQTLMAPITSTFSNIQSAWSGLLQKLATGSITIGGFVKGVFTSVGQAIVGMLADMAAKWAVNALTGLLISKTSAASEIMANAGVAGAAATASAAAIPFYGWAMAPEAGAAAFAAAMSYLPSAAASRGYDIPSSINPIVQAHASEMILPQKYADVIRTMAEGGQARGGAQAPAEANVHLNATPLKGGFWVVHQDDLVGAIKRAHRGGSFWGTKVA